MTSYLEEKESQVNPGNLVAFGINIVSRYSKADELIEMLKFAQRAALDGVSDAVEEAFYDSKACSCSFKFTRHFSVGDPIERKLFTAAITTIRQFDWFGTVHHRGEDDA